MADPVFRGRVALVTGGSRGIGRAVAEELARAGASVAIGFRADREAAERARAALEALGVRALPVAGDLAEERAARDASRRSSASSAPSTSW
jgi:3-oxoacyl-[acyl-carrier protein] reductase